MRRGCFFHILVAITAISSVVEKPNFLEAKDDYKSEGNPWPKNKISLVQSYDAVVAADDGRCSEVGASMLSKGGHAVDAAIATALCLGVVSSTSSGLGGGGFMVVRDSSLQSADAINMREAAPSAASRDMYADDPTAKSSGPKSVAVPGELAGLHAAWLKYGRLPWRDLFEPAIKFAKEGFVISPFTGYYLVDSSENIMKDPGLREIFMRNGKLVEAGDVCYNMELGNTLEAIAEQGPKAFYDGPIGERLVDELQESGGILKMDDLRSYKAIITEAISNKAFGYEILGAPPPSSGALGLSLVLNVLDGYGSKDALRDPVGLHRLVEALKHMFAIRMDLGDPDFEDIIEVVSNMVSKSFADGIREKIKNDTTLPAESYKARWRQLEDRGTSHICVVDYDRNVVSMTTTLNNRFGSGIRSISTGVILNNEMDDFSVPTNKSEEELPPAEANYIEPNKRALSSATPIIINKDNQFAGALGCGGGPNIIPAVIQIFINHFVMGMEPITAVEYPRIYHSLDAEVVSYENWTVFNGKHFELYEERRSFLRDRGHKLNASGGAICQFVVQSLMGFEDYVQLVKNEEDVFRGLLQGVCDPRKGGWPAAALPIYPQEQQSGPINTEYLSTTLRGISTYILYSLKHDMQSKSE